MSIKRKLFASVAAPVLSLPLLIQPVYAIPPGFGNDPSLASPGIIRVQQEVVPEEAQQGEQPRRKRQDAEQSEGEQPKRREQRAQEEGGSEQPKRRQQQAEQPAEQPQEQPRQRAQQDAEQPAAEQPKRREQRAQDEGGSEQPKRRQQQAEEPQEQPRQRAQQNAEQPEAEQPKRREQRAQEEGGEKPRQREQQAEQPKPAEEPAQNKADQAPEPKETETKQAEPKQAEPTQAEPKKAEPKQAEPAQRQAEEPKASPEGQQNAEQPAAAETPQRNAEQPQGERPRQRDQQAGDGQGGERPRRGQQAQDGQPAAGTASPAETTSGGERPPQPAAQQQAEQPATLPVENGAAVLDSAKEQRPGRPARDGERPRRDPNRAAGQQAPAAQQAQEPAAPPPRTDADAQANDQNTREQREQWRNQRQELVDERGERMDRRPDFERPRGWDVRGAGAGDREPGRDRDRNRDRDGGRVIISIDDRTIVRHDDSRRFYEDGRQPEYERLGDGRFREVVERGDGTRVVTIRNRYGEVVQRSRIVRGGEEYVLYYAPELLEDRQNYTWRDPGDDLPPMRLGVPIDDYIIDTSSEPDRDYYEFLEQPPVERVERPYSLDEVRYSARIRDKVPRIDLDTITFATGSAEIPMNQASSLRKVADAINKVLEKDPAETFLIEGHTDAVGSDDSNLVLSDRRAESVAVVLSDAFGIPPENLTTQGYGEQYLKVNTEAANQENRRVTIRRITPLVKPVASKQ